MEQFCSGTTFFTGINYWASHAATNMWTEWDEATVESDFRKLRDAGISVLRVFPLWPVFQPLTAADRNGDVCEYRFGEEPLPDTPAGRAGVSEEACEHFEALCALADRYGMRLVVPLLTGQMSFRYYCPQAFLGRGILTDPTAVKWELRFVRYFVTRFRGQKCIAAWELGNEANCFADVPADRPDAADLWAAAVTDAVHACDGTRPVVSGLDSGNLREGPFNDVDLGDSLDVLTSHVYNIFSSHMPENPSEPLCTMVPVSAPSFRARLHEQISGKPAFVEEFGSIGYLNCSEKSEADFYRAVLFSCWAHGRHGAMWWCAFDQGQMEFAPYDWNNIGSDYGFFRADGSEKPIVEENRSFTGFLKGLPFGELPPRITDGVCLATRKCSQTVLQAADLIARQANLELVFADAAGPVPDTPAYFLPSIDFNHSISRRRLAELLEKVKNGSVLYLSLGDGLFRWIPEMTGVTFRGREQRAHTGTITVGGAKLPSSGGFFYEPEEIRAEVLGTMDGLPVFFRHAYGKGFVFLMTRPIEQSAMALNETFRSGDGPAFEAVYREVMRPLGTRHAAESSSRLIRLTEHPLDENRRVAVAVNYSDAPQHASLSFAEGWKPSAVYRGVLRDSGLSLGADDAAVFLLTRSAGKEGAE